MLLPNLASVGTAHLYYTRHQIERRRLGLEKHLKAGSLTCQVWLLAVSQALGQGHDYKTHIFSPWWLEAGTSIPRERETETEGQRKQESGRSCIAFFDLAFRSHAASLLSHFISLKSIAGASPYSKKGEL